MYRPTNHPCKIQGDPDKKQKEKRKEFVMSNQVSPIIIIIKHDHKLTSRNMVIVQ